MTPEEMKKRLKDYALRCIKLAASLPSGAPGDVIRWQLTKASTSAAANYRAACIARSRADFVSKLGMVEEEADESVFWVDLATDAQLVKRTLVQGLLVEGEEIVKIVAQSRITAKSVHA